MRYGADISQITDDMEKQGYEWSGWTGFPADGKMPAGNVEVTGHYEASTDTKYAVRYWYQNVEDDEYAEHEDERKEGKGTTGGLTNVAAGTVEGFTAKDVAQQTIEADGSTVVNVYYDRNVHKVTYQVTGTYFTAPEFHEESVRYGAELKQIDADMERAGYEWSGWSGLPATMPDSDVKVTGSYSTRNDTEYTVQYWLQNAGDDGYTMDTVKSMVLKGETGAAVGAPAQTYEGMEHVTREESVESGTIAADGSLVLKVYYDRKTYSITYKVTGELFADDSFKVEGPVRYGADISQITDDMEKQGYEWSGWTGFPADGKMPAGNVEVTGHYEASTDTKYAVRYWYQNPEDGEYESETEIERYATTGEKIRLSDSDIVPDLTHTLESGRYIFDESDSRNILEGNVAGDGSLKLHVYFPIEYTINGRIDHGTVTESNQNVRYAAASSAMSFTAERNYVIKSIMVNGEEQTVTPNQMTYTYPVQSNIKEDIEVQVTTEEMKAELTLTKTRTNEPANKTGYVLGEAIEYKIVAKNTGNLTLNNVIVKDALVNGIWTIQGNLEPNEEREFTASYTVREDDIKAKEVVNTVTAEVPGLGPDYPEPDIIPDEDKAPVDVPTPSLYVEKVASGNDVPGKKYEEGEVVTYTIKVINNGNVTISNIVVEDPLTGMVWDVGTLVPSDSAIPLIRKPSKEKDTKYTIKADDILAGKVVNTVTVSGVDPDGNPVGTTDTETIRTNDVRTDYSVAKEITSSSTHADGTYHVGDTIEYKITITSDANVVLENVRIADQLSNATNAVVFTGFDANKVTIGTDNVATITELVPGETVILNCEYTVTRQDALLNAGLVDAGIRNSASVTADPVQPTNPDDPNPKPVPEKETDPVGPAAVERVYTLTVNYVYEAGGIAATSVIGQYLAGEIYRVDSPVIDGYTRADFVAGQMPNNDLVLTVVYAAVATPPAPGGDPAPDPVDPDTPPVPPVTPVDEVPDPVVPPVVPEGPAVPEAPVVPGTPETVLITAPAAPALVAVGDAPVPLQGALIETDDDGNVTVTPITEEEIPLANKEIDDHKCCIMSFLLMLATLIIYSWFTHSMKKRQKKLAELKDQLAEETLKRQLGITDKTSNRR